MKLQILIPQYKETDEVVKPLLDSLAIQQNIDMNEIGVVIVNDGSDVHLTPALLGDSNYKFNIDYILNEHKGVSATRNMCLKCATADYVMFCDADDMFCNVCGLYIIFNEINNGGFDALVSNFIEETLDQNKNHIYVNHEMDSTFVHGKVYRREYLIQNNIWWNDNLTIHEDSYFNCLGQRLTENAKYCPAPFYLWRWRDDSVCRHDPKYILKTYNNMIDSNTALVMEFEKRNRLSDAQFYVTMLIYDAYFTMNKDEWISQDNKDYRDNTERRFLQYYQQFKYLYDSVDTQVKAQIIMGIKNRMYAEGLLMEKITFDDWIKEVESKYISKEGEKA